MNIQRYPYYAGDPPYKICAHVKTQQPLREYQVGDFIMVRSHMFHNQNIVNYRMDKAVILKKLKGKKVAVLYYEYEHTERDCTIVPIKRLVFIRRPEIEELLTHSSPALREIGKERAATLRS